MASRLSVFLLELKRRRVYRVACVYVIVGVGVLGAAEVILDPLGLEALRPYLVILVLLGLPIALVLAWAYEVRPEGGDPALARGPSPWGTIPPSPDGIGAPPKYGQAPSPLPRDRIAVLPFASIHPDREHDYFADGITEELISAISRIQGLDVIARTSVVKYKGSDARIAEIARELNVGVVLEGSVRKAGDQLRVTVQLINAESEGHLWAEDYDREFREIFAVQRDIASQVAAALRLRLRAPEAERIGKAPTEDLAAYDLYLLGRHSLNLRSDAGIRQAIASFQRAVERDGDFALGYAGLADAHILAALGYVSEPLKNARPLAQECAERALRLNEWLPEAHTSLGYAALLAWDTRTAEREFRRAIEINPSHAQAHQWMGHLLVSLGRPLEAIEGFTRASELDPLSAVLVAEVGFGYYYAGDPVEALVFVERSLGMDPSLPIAHYNRGLNLLRLDRLGEAMESFRRTLQLVPGLPFVRAFLAAALAQYGREDEARDLLAALVAEDSVENPVRTYIAHVQEALGMKEEALRSLRQAVDRREPLGIYISLAWLPFPSLQSNPEFQALVQEIDRIVGR